MRRGCLSIEVKIKVKIEIEIIKSLIKREKIRRLLFKDYEND